MRNLLPFVAIVLAAALAGCGNGGGDEAPPKVEGTVPVQTATAPPPGPGGAAPGAASTPPGDGK